MDDVVLTFDTRPFENGIKKVGQGFTNLEGKVHGVARATSSGFEKAINGMIGKVAVFAAGFLSIRKALTFLPEVGRTFQLAGDIFMRNLLWPLRKLLIPMLQKILDWTRDHRKLFVQWGVHIANAFRVVMNIVKMLIELGKTFVQSFINRFEAIFGKVTRSFTDIANIIMFKITAICQFLLILLKPVFDTLGKMFADTAAVSVAFFKGVMEGVGDIIPVFEDLIGSLGRLYSIFSLTNGEANKLMQISVSIGKSIGGTLRIALETLAQAVDTVALGIQSIGFAAKMAEGWIRGWDMKKLKAEGKAIFGGYGERATQRGENIIGAGKRSIGIEEGTETKVKSLPEYRGRLGASASGRGVHNIDIRVAVGDIKVDVKTIEEARVVGEGIGAGISREIEKKLRIGLRNAMEAVPS